MTIIFHHDTIALLLPRAIELDWGVNQDDRAFLRRISRQGGTAGNRPDRKRLNRLLGEFARAVPLPDEESDTYDEPASPENEPVYSPQEPDLHRQPKEDVPEPLTTSIQAPLAICDGWRVAFDELQWVLQHWRAPRRRDRAFCRSRSGLELRIRELIGPEYQVVVSDFPDWHPNVDEAPPEVVNSHRNEEEAA